MLARGARPTASAVAGPVCRQRSVAEQLKNILKNRTAIVYDPHDLATMYQDSSGTLPVYRPGSGQVDPPVGLLLDKSLGLELGPELFLGSIVKISNYGGSSGAYNATTNELSNTTAGTLNYGPTFIFVEFPSSSKRYLVTVSFAGAVDKVTSVTLVNSSPTTGITTGGVSGAAFVANGGTLTWRGASTFGATGLSVWTDGRTTWDGLFIESISVREIKGYHAYQNTPTARPKLSGRYNQLDATETLSTQSVTTAATTYTLRFEGTGTVTLSGTATGTYSAGTHTITCTAGSLTLTVAGSVTRADLRVKRDGSSLPAYQRVDDANTYDTAGFPLYLRRDKVDDDLIVQSPAITGQRAWCSIDTVDIAAATIAAGSYQPFGTINAGEPTCTQWIAIDGELTSAEQAVLERYVYSKSKLPVGA